MVPDEATFPVLLKPDLYIKPVWSREERGTEMMGSGVRQSQP